VEKNEERKREKGNEQGNKREREKGSKLKKFKKVN
jgi:hypothetical protein